MINEVHFRAGLEIPEDTSREFIELHNPSADSCDVGGFRFVSGVEFTIPPRTRIAAGGFLIVAADVPTFQKSHTVSAPVVGGWRGRLSNDGEKLRLVDRAGQTVAEVRYATEGEWAVRTPEESRGATGWTWSKGARGTGYSLELIDPAAPPNLGANWAVSQVIGGTPGAVNSVRTLRNTPLIVSVRHDPVVPTDETPVTVSASVKGPGTPSLVWRVAEAGESDFKRSDMRAAGPDGMYVAQIPSHADGVIIEYYVEVSSGDAVRTWPAAATTGQVTNALLQFDEERLSASVPSVRIIMTPRESHRFAHINRFSDAQMHATVIVDAGTGPVARHQCGVRVRGESSRVLTPHSIRVNIPNDAPVWNRTRFNINANYSWLQHAGLRLLSESGVLSPDSHQVLLRINGDDPARSDERQYGHFVLVEAIDVQFLKTHFPRDARGNLYKKVQVSRPALGPGLEYHADDIDEYRRDGWTRKSNASRGDWSDLDDLLYQFNHVELATADGLAELHEQLDLAQWLRWLAAMNLMANTETCLATGKDEDYCLYRLKSGRFLLLPHDLDAVMGQGDGVRDPRRTMFDMIEEDLTIEPLQRLFANADVRDQYLRIVGELLDTSFDPERVERLMHQELVGWVPKVRIKTVGAWMKQRREYVLGVLEESGHPHHRTTLPPDSHRLAASRSTRPKTESGIRSLVPFDARWRYLRTERIPSDWNQPEFSDRGWFEGRALFGHGHERLIAAAIGTPMAPAPTVLFRHDFLVNDDFADRVFRFGTILDDGAAIYVNGTEVRRLRLEQGETRASASVEHPVDEGDFEIPRELIRKGRNTIAVELRQAVRRPADLAFGLTLWSETARATDQIVSSAGCLLADLRISEIMYHPVRDQPLEFIEVTNTGSRPLDLDGVHFSDGVTFTFGAVILGPGEAAVVVSDRKAFVTEYGPGIRIAGVFKGRLSNRGERLRLSLPPPSRATITEVAYDDGWCPETDGFGFSLVCLQRSEVPSRGDWVASAEEGGTPGRLPGDRVAGGPLDDGIRPTGTPGFVWLALILVLLLGVAAIALRRNASLRMMSSAS